MKRRIALLVSLCMALSCGNGILLANADADPTYEQKNELDDPIAKDDVKDLPIEYDTVKTYDTSSPYDTTVPASTSSPYDTTVPAVTTSPSDTSAPVDTSSPTDTTSPVDTSEPSDTDTPDEPEKTVIASGISGNITWTLYEDGELVISGTGKMKDYSGSGSPWYSYKNDITSVIITEGVNSIGNYAFYNCKSLTSINIPVSVTSIGDWAFYNCKSLTSISIPDGVTSIGYAFRDCTSLTRVDITDIAAWCNIEFSGYYSNPLYYAQKLYVNGSLATDLIIPDSVTSIGDLAFYKCTSLTSIDIPDSVTSIGQEAFYNCNSLTRVDITDIAAWCNIEFSYSSSNPLDYANYLYLNETLVRDLIIPDGVTSIGDYAFNYCTSLTSITIPNSVISIGSKAFQDCDYLESVTFGNGVTSIGDYAFYNCDNLADVTIGNCVTSIGNDAFSSCDSLTSITIPDSVTSIGSDAFWCCSNLIYITVGSGVISIGGGAFSECYKLAEVVNNSSLNIVKGDTDNGYIAYYALDVHSGKSEIQNEDGFLFYSVGAKSYLVGYVGNDREITLPDKDGGYEIYQHAFYCSSIESVVIPQGVPVIGNSAFAYCSRLVSITIPSSITKIEAGAFDSETGGKLTNVYISDIDAWMNITFENQYSTPMYAASNIFLNGQRITEIIIPEGTEKINDYTFYGFSDVKSIVMPDSVTSIGKYSFLGCSDVTSIMIPNDVTNIDDFAFRDCGSLVSVTIPDKVTSIGSYAFAYCNSLTSVTIGDSVTSIGDYAFYECDMLVEIINNSSLNIVKGNTDNGYVGYYALEIYSGDTKVQNEDGFLFRSIGDKTYLVGYVGSDSEITLPRKSDGYEIMSNAFYGCDQIVKVVIPDSITRIGEEAFARCNNLVSVTLESEISIDNRAFYECYNLVEVINNSSMNIIKGNNDNGCIAIYALEVHSGDGKVQRDGDYLFYSVDGKLYLVGYAGNDTVLVLPSRDEGYEINNNAFRNRHEITDVIIPECVTGIGYNAFYDCSGLTVIAIPNSVTSIGLSAFSECDLFKVVLGENIEILDHDAFGGLFGKFSSGIELEVIFLGNAPSIMGDGVFELDYTTIYFHEGAEGFTTPKWNGYPCIMLFEETDDLRNLDENNTASNGLIFTLDAEKQTATVSGASVTAENAAMIIPTYVAKYSLQGTTQGRYLTGGVPPVRFSM